MSAILVIQSHRVPLPCGWLQLCLDSVASWARGKGYDYRFIDDQIFDLLEPGLLEKTRAQPVIASDLARLKSLQQSLVEGYAGVIWCDADFLIFDADGFVLPEADFALGREVWVQPGEAGNLRAYVKVHNALLMFRQGNHFLDFYTDTAERLLGLNQGSMPPQFIGPKLLTALHNIAICPVMETAGMLSPAVMRDLLAGGGKALDLFHAKSPVVLAGANLSSSLTEREGLTEAHMKTLIQCLLSGRSCVGRGSGL
jgi:hypothetical protein